MKKVKAFKWMFACTLVALCVGFASCSDDDDNENSGNGPLVGSWQVVHRAWTSIYNERENSGEDAVEDGAIVKFMSNGTWSSSRGEEGFNSGTYSYNEGTILVTYPNGEQTALVVTKLTDAEMVIIAEETEDGIYYKEETTYTKVQ